MPRWVDVRVPQGMAAEALEALVPRFQPLTLSVDLEPPGTPSVEVSVQDVPEPDLLQVLGAAGIPVLAIRSRLGEPLAATIGAAA